jgi:hypothetical protein
MEMKQISVVLKDGEVVITQEKKYGSAGEISITPEQVSLLIQFLYEVIEAPIEFKPEAMD